MQITKERLKNIIKEEIVRTADLLPEISNTQKNILEALSNISLSEAAEVIAIYESLAAEKIVDK